MNTFPDYLVQQSIQHNTPKALLLTLASIVAACQKISRQVRLGELSGIIGEAGTSNIQGEVQKKLDVIANQILLDSLTINPHVAGIASEEEDDFIAANENGAYLVLFDPLDGSSNIDVNISIGTIFSVLVKPTGSLKTESFLQKGREQVAAGYVLYGVQTLLVLTLGHGVFMFTLDETGEFIASPKLLHVPQSTNEFAINASNQRHWEAPIRHYIGGLLAGKSGVRGKDFNMRWVASMVAEVHRILMRGGIFLYPKDNRHPNQAGKLRLMYEANPLGWLVEQAGGTIINAHENILDIQPNELHQRVAVILGSSEEVAIVQKLHQ